MGLLAEKAFPEASSYRGKAEFLLARYSIPSRVDEAAAQEIIDFISSKLAEQKATPLEIRIYRSGDELFVLAFAYGSPIVWPAIVWGIIGLAVLGGLIYLAHIIAEIEWIPEAIKRVAEIMKWIAVLGGLYLVYVMLKEVGLWLK